MAERNAQQFEFHRFAAVLAERIRPLDEMGLEVRSLKQEEGDDWLYFELADLGSDAFCLFYDGGRNARNSRLWYGWFANAGRHAVVMDALTAIFHECVQLSDKRTLGEEDFGRLVYEKESKNIHWLGVYMAQDGVRALPQEQLVDQVVEFVQDSVVALQNHSDKAPELRQPVQVMARRGQATFRSSLLRAYGSRCCVTACSVKCLLEAAHIVCTPGQDDHSIHNGLLLRSDIHTLFDLGWLRIHPDLRIEFDAELAGLREFKPYHGTTLRLAQGVEQKRLAQALATRLKNTRKIR